MAIPTALYLILANSAVSLASPHASLQARHTDVRVCLLEQTVPFEVASAQDLDNNLVHTYNSRLPYLPAAIVLPQSVQHVQDAVVCARDSGVAVQAKSGGHSYASYSTGGQNGSLIINLENFQDVQLDEGGVAAVGAGVRLGRIDEQIYEQGQRAVAHGTCPGVGIGGHYTHGGFGYSSRNWGLALDSITVLDAVLANGSFVQHISATEFPDLYWGMRGAADSFGIVTTFYIQTEPAPQTVINFAYEFDGVLANVPSAVQAVQGLQAFVQDANIVDRRLGLGMTFGPGAEQALRLSGVYHGSRHDFDSKIAPALLLGLPFANWTNVQEVDWITNEKVLGNAQNTDLEIAANGSITARQYFYAKSVTAPKPFLPKVLESFFTFITSDRARLPPVGLNWFTIINLEGGPDSQITNKDNSFSALGGRDTFWAVQNYAWVESPGIMPESTLIDFVDDLNGAMTSPMDEYGAVLNYVDPQLSPVEAHQLYYGPEIYARLREVKKKYDPQNVFRNPQSVEVGA